MRITAPDELAFPDYDGNGMFKSLGNILVNPNVGLLFIDLHQKPKRLRVNGTALVSRDDPLLAHTVGAQLIVRVKARAIFPNCPRYIPKLQLGEPSEYVPQPGHDPVEPAWKAFDAFKDAIHPRQPTFTVGTRGTRTAARGGVKMRGRSKFFTPTPDPSPQGGGEHARAACKSTFSEIGY